MSDIESRGKALPPEHVGAAIELWSQDGPTHWLPVSGRSMLPGLRKGDYVIIHRLTQGYEAGAILTVKHTGGIISHRLLAIHQQADGKTLYITKGDNSPYLDPPTKEEDVIGQVTTIRRGNRALSFETDTWIRVNRRIAYLMHGN